MNWSKNYLAKRTNPERREGTLAERYAAPTPCRLFFRRRDHARHDPYHGARSDHPGFAQPEPEILPHQAEEAARCSGNRPQRLSNASTSPCLPGFFPASSTCRRWTLTTTCCLRSRCLAGLVPPQPASDPADVLDFGVARP